ncbi:MAG: GtrA family protein [Methanoregula sp.]|nr:GtrA family protein [Methanoregula sp.]
MWDEWWQILRFVSVGVSGMVVNWGSYGILSRMLGMEMLTAALVAIECSIISNFLLHDRWTFASSSRVTLRRFGMFQGISTVGMVIQMLTFSLLVAMVGSEYDLLVYPAGILVAFVWNYMGNRHITWKPGAVDRGRVNTRMWRRRVRP